MIFVLSKRIQQSNRADNNSVEAIHSYLKDQKCIILWQRIVLSFVTMGFITFVIVLYIRADTFKGSDETVDPYWQLYSDLAAYGFLLCFVLMAAANIALLVQIKAHNKVSGETTYNFEKF